jgi:hypothetical protein
MKLCISLRQQKRSRLQDSKTTLEQHSYAFECLNLYPTNASICVQFILLPVQLKRNQNICFVFYICQWYRTVQIRVFFIGWSGAIKNRNATNRITKPRQTSKSKIMALCLFVYLLFYISIKNVFHLYGDVTITGDGCRV